MIRQKQIKFLSFPDLTTLSASTLNTPEFAYIVSANAFYTRVSGVNTKIDPFVALNLGLGTLTATTVPLTISGGGTGETIPAATGTLAGALPAADKVKLDFITVTALTNLDTIRTNLANAITLTGVAANATNLGTFTGTTIADNVTIKDALQALETNVELKVNTSLLGAVNGVAQLDGSGKVPASQLPAYVDDVLEYVNLAAFPAIGSTGIIYVDITTNKVYRWSGSVYIEISSAPNIPVTSVFGRTGAVVSANGDYTASQITNVPAGNIAAVTVQAAIAELDTEKQADIQIINEGSNVGTPGQYTAINFIGAGINAVQNGVTASQLDVTVTKGFTDKFDKLIPTATNTVPNMSAAPLNAAEVVFYVNGILESAGISCNGSGVITVVAGTLGYSVETTDVVQVIYTAA